MKRKISDVVPSDIAPSVLKRPRSNNAPPIESNIDTESNNQVETESTSSISSSADDSSSEEPDTSDSDEASDQESSSSSEGDSSSSDSQSDSSSIMNVLLRKSPSIQPVHPSGLENRLSSFLPALAAANASLDQDREDGVLSKRILDQDDGHDAQYIEMNLGLGVLEQNTVGPWEANATSPPSSSASEAAQESRQEDGKDGREKTDVMVTLMGGKVTRAHIEEVDGG